MHVVDFNNKNIIQTDECVILYMLMHEFYVLHAIERREKTLPEKASNFTVKKTHKSKLIQISVPKPR